MTAVNMATVLLVLVSIGASFGVWTGRMKLPTTCVVLCCTFAVVAMAAVYDRMWWYTVIFVFYTVLCAVIWCLARRRAEFQRAPWFRR